MSSVLAVAVDEAVGEAVGEAEARVRVKDGARRTIVCQLSISRLLVACRLASIHSGISRKLFSSFIHVRASWRVAPSPSS